MAVRDVAMFELGLRDYGSSWTRLQEALSVQQKLYGTAAERPASYGEDRQEAAAVRERQSPPPAPPVNRNSKGSVSPPLTPRSASSESVKSSEETSKAHKSKGIIGLITRAKETGSGKKSKKNAKSSDEKSKPVAKERGRLTREKSVELGNGHEEKRSPKDVYENGKGDEKRHSCESMEKSGSKKSPTERSPTDNRPHSPTYRNGPHHERTNRKAPVEEGVNDHEEMTIPSPSRQKEQFERVIRKSSRDELLDEHPYRDQLASTTADHKSGYKRISKELSRDEGLQERPLERPAYYTDVKDKRPTSKGDRPPHPKLDMELSRDDFPRERGAAPRGERPTYPRPSRESSRDDCLKDETHRSGDGRPVYPSHSRESPVGSSPREKSFPSRDDRRMYPSPTRESSMDVSPKNKSSTSRGDQPEYPRHNGEALRNGSPKQKSLPHRDDWQTDRRISRESSRDTTSREGRVVSPGRGQPAASSTGRDLPKNHDTPPSREQYPIPSRESSREDSFVDYSPTSPVSRNVVYYRSASRDDDSSTTSPSCHKNQTEFRLVSRESSRQELAKEKVLLDDDEELMMLESQPNVRCTRKLQSEQVAKAATDAPKPQNTRCIRCGDTVYPKELVTPKPGVMFHSGCFKCRECGVKLTLQTYFTNQRDTRDSDVYCRTHVPRLGPGTVDGNALNILTSKNSKDIKFSRYSKGSDADILLSSKVISQKEDLDGIRDDSGGLRYM